MREKLPFILKDGDNELTTLWRAYLSRCYDELITLIARLEQDDRALATLQQDNEDYQHLLKVPGIGPVLASAAIASIGNGAQFASAR